MKGPIVAYAVWVIVAITVPALARALRHDTFFVGDPGVKLIAARSALAHPSRPLEIELPTISGEPVPFIDPFFALHGNHAHAIASELFPLLSAPLIQAFGVRGAYVLPALGFLLAIGGCAWIAVGLDRRRNPTATMLAAVLGTPFLFYGLEFWEHAPAVGVAALATARFVKNATTADPEAAGLRSTAEVPRFGPARRSACRAKAALFAGLLFGTAVLLRPEALWFVVSVLACSPLLSPRPRPSTIMLVAAGTLAALLPVEIYTLSHFGNVVGPHVAGNAGLVSREWMPTRALIVSTWFFGAPPVLFWYAAPSALVAMVPVKGVRIYRGRAFLAAVAALDVALVVLTAPNDGGGQWGPRYLLFACIPLAVLAGDVLQSLDRRHAAGAVVLILLFLAGVSLQRTAYRRLRGAKLTYGRVVELVAREVPAGGHAVTDLWWLDQIAAVVTTDRQILFAGNGDRGAEAVRRLDRSQIAGVTVFRSRVESPDVGAWNDGTCYREEGRREVPERTLVAIRLGRHCP